MRYYKLFFFILIPVLLILPLFHMNTVEITEQENRTLVKFPETIKKNKPNYEFGKEFENWLGDRFWGRDQLIKTHFQAMYKINGRIENDKAFVGDNGWMFRKKDIINITSLKKQKNEIEKYKRIMDQFNHLYNIPIYIVIIPNRNDIYQQYYENYYTPRKKLDFGKELKTIFKNTPNIHIVDFQKDLITALKNNEVAYKTDIHLNFIGNEIIRNGLYKKIQQELFPNTNINYSLMPKKGIRYSIASLLNIKDLQEKDLYYFTQLKFNPPHVFSSQVIMGQDQEKFKEFPMVERVTSHEYISDKDLVIIGNCYAVNLGQLFSPFFKRSYYFKNNIGNRVVFNSVLEAVKKVLSKNSVLIIYDVLPNSSVLEPLNSLLDKTSLNETCEMFFYHPSWKDCIKISSNTLIRESNGDTATYKREGDEYQLYWPKYNITETFICDEYNICIKK